MVKVIIATLLGGVWVFAWGFLAWTVLPLHKSAMHTLPDEAAMVRALEAQPGPLQHGVYYLPAMPEKMDWNMESPEAKAYGEKYKNGPVAMFQVKMDGLDPEMRQEMLRGAGISLGFALLVAIAVAAAGAGSFPRRWIVAFICSAGGMSVNDLMMWNWMYGPWDFTQANLIDHAVTAVVLATIMAGILRPRGAMEDAEGPGALVSDSDDAAPAGGASAGPGPGGGSSSPAR
ncbi:MAG: hypothetical protein HY719_12395 [Planctomycetes bacterium]|nr:hypothetical protein [Planctomycetota bacterium]